MAAHSDFAPEVSPVEARRGDAYLWRLATTSVSFLLFGIGALVVGVVLLPLVRIIPAVRERRRARARAVMRYALRLASGSNPEAQIFTL